MLRGAATAAASPIIAAPIVSLLADSTAWYHEPCSLIRLGTRRRMVEPSGVTQAAGKAQLYWRVYAASLLRRWPLILLVAGVFAVAAYAVSMILLVTVPSYDSEAVVLIARPRYQVELESKIRSNQDPLAAANTYPGSQRSRGETLAILARSPEVEQAVQQRLAGRLSESDLRPQELVRRIKVRPNNDLLRISASAGDPQLAAEVANAWADEATRRFEAIYGASAGTADVDAEVENARRAFEAASQALNQFLIDHPVENMNRQMQAKIDEIKQLENQRVGALRTRSGNVFASLATLDQLIRDAETLRAQLLNPTQSRAASAGDALAMITLRSRSYLPSNNPFLLDPSGTASVQGRPQSPDAQAAPAPLMVNPATPPNNVQVNGGIDFPTDSPAGRVADLDTMIQALRSRRAELQGEVDALSQHMRTGHAPSNDAGVADDDVLAQLDAALTQATAEVQTMRAEWTDLARQRDDLSNKSTVLETTYKTLVNKAQELRVQKATAAGEGASVVVKAVPPLSPAMPRPALYAFVAGIVGLLFGSALALSTALRGQPRSRVGVGGVLRPTAPEPGP